MEKVRIGIIGTGFTIGIAKSHYDGYIKCENAQVAAVYDILPGRAQAFLDRHKIEGVAVCGSLEELFSMVDAVSLCVPNCFHAELAIKAMEAGKHVLVEKPFSVDAQTGIAAVEAAKAHPGIVAMTSFNYREQAAVQYMKEIVDSGVLGKIRFVRHHGGGGRIANAEGVYLEWRMRKETSGTGSLADFGAHMLDLSDWMLREQCGQFVSYSAAVTTSIPERYVIDGGDVMGGKKGDEKAPVTNDDTASFTAVTDKGVLFSFVTSRINLAGADFEIVGENGAISNSTKWPQGTIGMSLINAPLPGETEVKFGMHPVPIPEKYRGEGTLGVQHYGVICEFIDCILHGKKPVRDLERGLFIQREIDLFAQAAQEGRTITA
jgi:predicted dehydrogenase